jgi:hypothetical protein
LPAWNGRRIATSFGIGNSRARRRTAAGEEH